MELKQTLAALRLVRVPGGCSAEIIVVDNGSGDDTRQVIESTRHDALKARYVCEPTRGKVSALHAGMKAANGEVMVFTDDDVRPEPAWLERMVAPLFDGSCDAVVGRTELASEMSRPWMRTRHRARLAAVEPDEGEVELVGANMAFHRRVLERVPAFDSELGPGALGLCEDTLFSWQVKEAGYRMRLIEDAKVVHHPESDRLLRSQWLVSARSQGRSRAYILHHWEHKELKRARLRALYYAAKLIVRRELQPPPALNEEGFPLWEMSYVVELEINKQFLKERKRIRNYACHGLIKEEARGKH